MEEPVKMKCIERGRNQSIKRREDEKTNKISNMAYLDSNNFVMRHTPICLLVSVTESTYGT
jgi:hypothetical protein